MGSSRARQLTKDHQNLGACSPRETHLKEPTSAHKLSSYVLLVGTPICQNAGNRSKIPRQGTDTLSKAKTPLQGTNTLSKAKTPLQGTNTLPKAKSLANLSPNTWLKFPSLVFAPRVSFLSYTSWSACALKGIPRHRASRDLTSRGLTPPGLVEP